MQIILINNHTKRYISKQNLGIRKLRLAHFSDDQWRQREGCFKQLFLYNIHDYSKAVARMSETRTTQELLAVR